MEESSFIFFQFFQRLRKELEIELDAEQFESFMFLFIKGAGTKTKEEILELCRCLWLTKKKYKKPFEELFDELWPTLTKYIGKETYSTSSNPIENTGSDSETKEKDLGASTQKEIASPESSIANDNTFQKVLLSFSEGKGFPLQMREEKKESLKEEYLFIFSDKYFPISTRRAIQIWRRINTKRLTFPTRKIDIEGIIEQIARQKFIEKIIFQKESEVWHKVVFLMDCYTNMTAFQSLGDHLYRTYQLGNPTAEAVRYYYLNCPIKSLEEDETSFQFFLNKSCTASISYTNLIKQNGPTSLVIFSTAWINDSLTDMKLIEHFLNFLNIVQKRGINIIWLNPYPTHRWKGTMAEFFSSLIPMFPINESGLLKAAKFIY